jgi:hypothetical protein
VRGLSTVKCIVNYPVDGLAMYEPEVVRSLEEYVEWRLERLLREHLEMLACLSFGLGLIGIATPLHVTVIAVDGKIAVVPDVPDEGRST